MTDDEIKALRRGDVIYAVRRASIDNEGNQLHRVYKYMLAAAKLTEIQLKGMRATIPLDGGPYRGISRMTMGQLRGFYKTPDEAVHCFVEQLNQRDELAREKYESLVADNKIARKWAMAWKGEVK